MSIFRKALAPTHWIYLLLHLVLVLIGYALTLSNATTWYQPVGGSLIAAGFAGWVIFVYIFLTESTKDKIILLNQFGLVNAFASRGASIKSVYDEKLSSVQDHIDILGFGLRALREDYRESFVSWQGRAVVRILLLDPDYPAETESYANQRDREEGSEVGTIAREVRQFVQETRSITNSRFQIRLYRCLPSCNIFRVDDSLFWGPYLVGCVSRNSPTLLVCGGSLFETFLKQFDSIWESDELSREVPMEWRQPQN